MITPANIRNGCITITINSNQNQMRLTLWDLLVLKDLHLFLFNLELSEELAV